MIYRLEEKDYERVRPIFKPLDFNLTLTAVIEGTSPGRIYVDDIASPRTAFMCSAEGYYLSGYESNEAFNAALNKLIVEKISAGDTVRENEEELALCVHPEIWEAKLDALLYRSPIKGVRRHYLCNKLQVVDWKDSIPEGFSIRRIDRNLLDTLGSKVPRHIANWMRTNWGSIDHFMHRGFGFCMLHGKEVVSWCVADCASGDACEIGIHTRSDYRRRGLATLTAAATVDYCFSNGFRSIGWHCNEDNLGSRGVAEKVGFELERKYLQYYCMFNEAHHLAELGLAAFKAKRYRETVEYYERVFAAEDIPDWMPGEMHLYYHLAARAWAALGDSETALKYLDKAVGKGWTDLEGTKNCVEFTSLHEKAGWKILLEKLQRRADPDGQAL